MLKVAAEEWDEDEDFGSSYNITMKKPGEEDAKVKVEFERVEVSFHCFDT
jgi:hypothetical protein